MNELIHISEAEGRQVVDARELHTFLESKRQFGNWIQYRIKDYGFIEGVDYTSINKIVKREKGGTTRKEYALTISCAKELAMVEGNKKGKAARLFFIDCERRLRESSLQSRVATLEVQVADLRRHIVQTKGKVGVKQLPIGLEVDLVRKHFAAPKHDEKTRFMSCMEVASYIQTAEKIKVGPYRIAKALIELTSQRSSHISIGGHSVKRGYWVQTLTTLS